MANTHAKLKVDGKLVGECLCPNKHACTLAQMDRPPKNVPPAPSAGMCLGLHLLDGWEHKNQGLTGSKAIAATNRWKDSIAGLQYLAN